MKKLTSLLLCMALLVSLFCVNASAVENPCMEAGFTAAEDGTVTVTVTAKEPVANARLTVEFDSDYLTYVDCETAFAAHSVKAEEQKLTIGLANATENAVEAGGELIELRFAMTGRWDETEVIVTAVTCGGENVNEAVTLTVTGSGYRFEDVSAEQWFYEAVDYMASEGYIVGISQTHFGPGLNMSRADFVTLLGRLDGVAQIQAETCFTDVAPESYYSGYVAWAVENKITNGISATMFAPANPVSRAQMVTFLYRYVVSKGIDVSVADPDAVLEQFPDSDMLPDWSVAAFAWAIDRGVINGMDGMLAHNVTADRAQAAVMLYRFFFEQ